MRFTVQVYDVVLDAALQTQKCGPRKLLVTGEWEWLLNGFAGELAAAVRLDSVRCTSGLIVTDTASTYLVCSMAHLISGWTDLYCIFSCMAKHNYIA